MKLYNVTGLALMVGVGLGACASNAAASGSTAPTADAQSAAGDDQAAAELKEHHRHHHHGGVTQFIAMSLDTLGTDEAKRPQIEKIQDELHACLAPAHAIDKSVLQTISDGVAAGSIDAAKVDAAIAQLDAAAGAAHGCSVAALNELHAVLAASERQVLVDKVQAHYQVWRQVNHEAEAGGKEKGGRLADLTAELSLTPDQVDSMSTALHAAMAPLAGHFDPKRAEVHLTAFATAFVADSFDAKSLTANANGHIATHGAKRMALFYETITPFLTPDQRTKLADHLREHASHQPAVSSK
jgi:Spy/CpxP family protein refolding chaperone